MMTPAQDQFACDAPPAELAERYYAALAQYWLPVARETDLGDGEPRRVELLGRPLVLVLLDGKPAAMDDACRHFQARLSDGVVETGCSGHSGQVLRCRYHGWAFGPGGQCLEIPQLDEGARIPPAARVNSYPVEIAHGLLWVCMSPPALHPLPIVEEAGWAGMVPTRLEYTAPWTASLVRMVLSALDDYHFPWLHEGVLGTRDNVKAPTRDIRREGTTLVSRFAQVQPSNVTNAVHATPAAPSNVNYEMRVDMPNVIRLIKRNPDGGIYSVCFFPVPHAVRRTGIFWRVIRNYQTSEADEERIIEMESFIQSQDRDHVGGQRPWLAKPLIIKGADDALYEYLTWLRELGIPDNV